MRAAVWRMQTVAAFGLLAWVALAGRADEKPASAATSAPTASQPAHKSGCVILAGGGREAAPGDAGGWSARLYRHFLDGGDITGDGKVNVAIIARTPQSNWLPDYFKQLGAHEAVNVTIDTVEAADDPALDATFASIDAVFIKVGDQGKYYDLWNDRRIERLIRGVHARGGSVGGTSAGAMAMAAFALAGGHSPTSVELLADAGSPLLDDETGGGSAIHTDWLSFVPDCLIDSHVTERNRIGRTIAALARAVKDSGRRGLYAIALDEQSGVWIRDGRASVIGRGAATFVQFGDDGVIERTPGKPLHVTGVRMDRLIDGHVFDIARRRPVVR